MPNMSYCRFANTCDDLADCVMALDGVAYDGDSISEGEWRCAKRMKEWCERFIETFEDIEYNEIEINIED